MPRRRAGGQVLRREFRQPRQAALVHLRRLVERRSPELHLVEGPGRRSRTACSSSAFPKQKAKDRDYVCGEVQTKQRFGYGTYEARMKAVARLRSEHRLLHLYRPGPQAAARRDRFRSARQGRRPRCRSTSIVNGKSVGNAEAGRRAGRRRQGRSTTTPSSGRRTASRWYVNGKLVAEATDPAKLPSHPSKIYLSLWGSDTLKAWMGTFADPGAPIAAEIDRVAYTALGETASSPNRSPASSTSRNAVACRSQPVAAR